MTVSFPAFPATYALEALSASQDWDTFLTVGIRRTSGSSYSNAPLMASAHTGILQVWQGLGLTTRVQRWMETASGDIWQRSYDGTKWTMWFPVVTTNSTSNICEFFDDLFTIADTSRLTTNATGAGAVVICSDTGTNGYPSNNGICAMRTGTTATGACGVKLPVTAYAYSSGMAKFLRMETKIAIPTASSAAQRFSTLIGLSQGGLRASVDGIFFACVDNENSGNWVCVTDSGGVETVTNTAVAPSATQSKFRIEINAALSNVKFYINDTIVATHTTNLIMGGYMEHKVQVTKSVGITSRDVYLDCLYRQIQR